MGSYAVSGGNWEPVSRAQWEGGGVWNEFYFFKMFQQGEVFKIGQGEGINGFEFLNIA